MKRGIVAGLVLALGAVAPGAAEASSVLKVKDGKARRAHDPLLPPRSKTALPVVPRRAALSRRAVGTPVFGGMIAAALIGIFFIPMLYVVFQSMRERVKGSFGRRGRGRAHEAAE